jgi:hypothetical protein
VRVRRYIFNLSLTQQHFPSAWKESAIVPVLKSGDHASVSNYQPISILNNFSKIFECIIHDHVSQYTKLHPNQHGFSNLKIYSHQSSNFPWPRYSCCS